MLAVFISSYEIDFGGPVTKAVSMFTLSMINEGSWSLMNIQNSVAVPPIESFYPRLLLRKI